MAAGDHLSVFSVLSVLSVLSTLGVDQIVDRRPRL
jgi:hypothetical protein